MHKTQPEIASDTKLKRSGVTGIAIGALALAACELPIILALVGLGGLSAGIMAFRPPPVLEVIGIALIVMGAAMLLFRLNKRARKRRKVRHI